MITDTSIVNLRTRTATFQDIPELESMIDRSVRLLAGQDYSQPQIESALKYLLGVDPQLIEDGTYFVAVLDGQIVGSGGYSRRSAAYGRSGTVYENTNRLLNPRTDAARLRAMFVHPDYARRGIGRLLVRVSELAARNDGFRKMSLVATRTGEPLYRACGFRAVETIDIRLPDGEVFPGIHMEKTLVTAYDAAARARIRTTTMMRPAFG